MATDELSFIDEHERHLRATRTQTWEAVTRYASTRLGMSRRNPLRCILGPEPATGFAITEQRPGEGLVVAGRHRFARYRIEFELATVTPSRTRVRLRSYAAFPGPLGRAYRTAVVGSRGHVIAVYLILRSIEDELSRCK